MPPSLTFFQRPFPSANSILVHGTQPILIDTGFRTDAKRTVDLLHSVDTDPRDLQMVVNTHWHCDHAGGNSYLQTKYGVSIGAH
ncbi:MAG: MBL fold metallo-hydrolase, partial [Chloroflexota bacterium]